MVNAIVYYYDSYCVVYVELSVSLISLFNSSQASAGSAKGSGPGYADKVCARGLQFLVIRDVLDPVILGQSQRLILKSTTDLSY